MNITGVSGRGSTKLLLSMNFIMLHHGFPNMIDLKDVKFIHPDIIFLPSSKKTELFIEGSEFSLCNSEEDR